MNCIILLPVTSHLGLHPYVIPDSIVCSNGVDWGKVVSAVWFQMSNWSPIFRLVHTAQRRRLDILRRLTLRLLPKLMIVAPPPVQWTELTWLRSRDLLTSFRPSRVRWTDHVIMTPAQFYRAWLTNRLLIFSSLGSRDTRKSSTGRV